MESFIVESLRYLASNMFLNPEAMHFSWLKLVPLKINTFFWKLWQDRLPTTLNFIKMGLALIQATCTLCHKKKDYTLHLLLDCNFITKV